MRILILTPDTNIDRRIILQANELAKKGANITIVGASVSEENENRFSGEIAPHIRIKRINKQDVTYYEAMVQWYIKTHERIDCQISIVNDKFVNSNLRRGQENSFFMRIINYCRLRLAIYSTRIIVRLLAFGHFAVTIIYRVFLLWMGWQKKDFFPNFDKAFYNAGRDIAADCIVANDLPALRAGWQLAQEKGVPLVYDAHENYTEQCTLPKSLVRVFEQIENEILPQVRFWIVPNEFLGKAVLDKYKKRWGTEIQEPLVIQNAVSYISKPIASNIIRNKLGIAQSYKIVLFQGGYLPKRNLENMIQSMMYIKNPSIVMVLLGFGEYVVALQDLVRQNHLQNKVYFLPAVSQVELLEYTCSADVGLIPYGAVDKNTYYCSPNKLYEYIQGRLPILANDLPFLHKMIIDNNIGQVADFSHPREIATAIDRIFSDEQVLKAYHEHINEAAEKFSWEKEAKKLLGRYQEEFDIDC